MRQPQEKLQTEVHEKRQGLWPSWDAQRSELNLHCLILRLMQNLILILYLYLMRGHGCHASILSAADSAAAVAADS